jgi:hypothetical protein
MLILLVEPASDQDGTRVRLAQPENRTGTLFVQFLPILPVDKN